MLYQKLITVSTRHLAPLNCEVNLRSLARVIIRYWIHLLITESPLALLCVCVRAVLYEILCSIASKKCARRHIVCVSMCPVTVLCFVHGFYRSGFWFFDYKNTQKKNDISVQNISRRHVSPVRHRETRWLLNTPIRARVHDRCFCLSSRLSVSRSSTRSWRGYPRCPSEITEVPWKTCTPCTSPTVTRGGSITSNRWVQAVWMTCTLQTFTLWSRCSNYRSACFVCFSARCLSTVRGASAGASTLTPVDLSHRPPLWGVTPTAASTSGSWSRSSLTRLRFSVAWHKQNKTKKKKL